MKVNKQIIFVSILMMILSLLLLLICDSESLEKEIVIGVFTGTIISFVTALIYYYNDRQKIWDNIKTVLPDIYINLCLIRELTGKILPQIPCTTQLDSLNYRRILQLSEYNISFVLKCNVLSFSGIIKKSRRARAIKDFAQYIDKLYNLKQCINEVEISVLQADIELNKIMVKQNSAIHISENEYKMLNDKRHLVTVKSSKIHEYETSLLNELDKVAEGFYYRKKDSWGKRKRELSIYANKILEGIDK